MARKSDLPVVSRREAKDMQVVEQIYNTLWIPFSSTVPFGRIAFPVLGGGSNCKGGGLLGRDKVYRVYPSTYGLRGFLKCRTICRMSCHRDSPGTQKTGEHAGVSEGYGVT